MQKWGQGRDKVGTNAKAMRQEAQNGAKTDARATKSASVEKHKGESKTRPETQKTAATGTTTPLKFATQTLKAPPKIKGCGRAKRPGGGNPTGAESQGKVARKTGKHYFPVTRRVTLEFI